MQQCLNSNEKGCVKTLAIRVKELSRQLCTKKTTIKSKQTNSYATINNSTIVPPNAFKGGTIDSERKHTTDYSKWPPSASGPEATSCSSARYSNMRLAILCCDIYICVYVLYAKNSAPMATRGQQQCINNGNAIVCYAFRSDHVQCSELCSMACGPLTKNEKLKCL